MRTDTKEIVCRVAYLIGIKKPSLVSSYGEECAELLEQLAEDKEATIIDAYKEYGTDLYIGLVASISMSCTETIFYTMSVYFMPVHYHSANSP